MHGDVGLESVAKTQVTCRGPQAPFEFLPAAWRKEEVKILGCCSVSRGNWSQTKSPGCRKLSFEVSCLAALVFYSLASSGPQTVWSSEWLALDGLARSLSGGMPTSCLMFAHEAQSFEKILYGAQAHLNLVWGARLVRRAARMLARGTFREEGCRHAQARIDLRNFKSLDASLHAVRRSWRRARFVEWLRGEGTTHRREARALRGHSSQIVPF